MTLETPTDHFACSLRLVQGGLTRPAAITFGVHGPSLGTPSQVADAVFTSVVSALRSITDTSVAMGPVVTRGGTEADPIQGISAAAPVAGLRAGTSLPPNVGVLVEKSTARGGRRGRGRLFMPFSLQAASITETGALTAAEITTQNNAWSAFRTALSTNGVPMVLLHSTGITLTGDPDVVTSLAVDPVIGSQRRRLGR